MATNFSESSESLDSIESLFPLTIEHLSEKSFEDLLLGEINHEIVEECYSNLCDESQFGPGLKKYLFWYAIKNRRSELLVIIWQNIVNDANEQDIKVCTTTLVCPLPAADYELSEDCQF